MKHVEAVIQLYDPAFNLRRISAKRRNRTNPWFKRGKMFPHVLDVLRAAEGPLTVREIARAVLAAQGEPNPTAQAIRTLEGGIPAGLPSEARRAFFAIATKRIVVERNVGYWVGVGASDSNPRLQPRSILVGTYSA